MGSARFSFIISNSACFLRKIAQECWIFLKKNVQIQVILIGQETFASRLFCFPALLHPGPFASLGLLHPSPFVSRELLHPGGLLHPDDFDSTLTRHFEKLKFNSWHENASRNKWEINKLSVSICRTEWLEYNQLKNDPINWLKNLSVFEIATFFTHPQSVRNKTKLIWIYDRKKMRYTAMNCNILKKYCNILRYALIYCNIQRYTQTFGY